MTVLTLHFRASAQEQKGKPWKSEMKEQLQLTYASSLDLS
jgi:hypothetical protein